MSNIEITTPQQTITVDTAIAPKHLLTEYLRYVFELDADTASQLASDFLESLDVIGFEIIEKKDLNDQA